MTDKPIERRIAEIQFLIESLQLGLQTLNKDADTILTDCTNLILDIQTMPAGNSKGSADKKKLMEDTRRSLSNMSARFQSDDNYRVPQFIGSLLEEVFTPLINAIPNTPEKE